MPLAISKRRYREKIHNWRTAHLITHRGVKRKIPFSWQTIGQWISHFRIDSDSVIDSGYKECPMFLVFKNVFHHHGNHLFGITMLTEHPESRDIEAEQKTTWLTSTKGKNIIWIQSSNTLAKTYSGVKEQDTVLESSFWSPCKRFIFPVSLCIWKGAKVYEAPFPCAQNVTHCLL